MLEALPQLEEELALRLRVVYVVSLARVELGYAEVAVLALIVYIDKIIEGGLGR